MLNCSTKYIVDKYPYSSDTSIAVNWVVLNSKLVFWYIWKMGKYENGEKIGLVNFIRGPFYKDGSTNFNPSIDKQLPPF